MAKRCGRAATELHEARLEAGKKKQEERNEPDRGNDKKGESIEM